MAIKKRIKHIARRHEKNEQQLLVKHNIIKINVFIRMVPWRNWIESQSSKREVVGLSPTVGNIFFIL